MLSAVTTPLVAFAALSTDSAMYLYISYGMPIMAGLAYCSIGFQIFLAVLWLGLENKRFKGPPVGDETRKRKAMQVVQVCNPANCRRTMACI